MPPDQPRILSPGSRASGSRAPWTAPGRAALLREADIFVFPSTREGHPWVIVEALAAGLPIVSCDAGCIRESVLDGRNGRLVPMRDPETLARTISELLDDPERLGSMAAESRRHYLTRFTATTSVTRSSMR